MGSPCLLEMVADLAAAAAAAGATLEAVLPPPPPFWLALDDEPADARWIPLSPLELLDLKVKE